MVPEVKTMAAVCLASISIQRQGCFPSARSALPSSRRLRQVSALLPFCSPSMANSRILSFPSGMLSQMGRQTSEANTASASAICIICQMLSSACSASMHTAIPPDAATAR